MSEFYNRQGQPISVEVWSELRKEWDYRVVKKTETKGLFISTIWEGINYSFRGEEPSIFETMVFEIASDGGNGRDVWCERYSTLEAAETGHERLVNEIMDGTFKGYESD